MQSLRFRQLFKRRYHQMLCYPNSKNPFIDSRYCFSIVSNNDSHQTQNTTSNSLNNVSFAERYANRDLQTNKFSFMVGDYTSAEKLFTIEDVSAFSKLTNDENPIHTNVEYAKKYGFNGSIVHGIFTASLFGSAIGNNLPGAVLLGMNLKWKLPVEVGQKVVANVTVKKILTSKKMMICTLTAVNEENETVVIGDTTIFVQDLAQE